MKTKYSLFRRGEMFYIQDTATGKQTSLRTKDETDAKSLLEARNAAQRQPVLNLHLARAYLTASDPAFVERTWQTVMEQLQTRGKDSSRERYANVFKSARYDGLRNKKLLETTADDFFAVFKTGKPSIINFLKRLHNFALNLGWIALPIVAPYLWPKYEAKERRGITRDEQETILHREKKAEWKLFLELLWETGAAQSDAVSLTAEDIDWQTRTITYFRMKTGSRAQFTISNALERVLEHLPTIGPLFPNLSKFTANDRASRFRRRCHKAGVHGVTLHSYRYAWAERAKVVGMPERFAQAALGHTTAIFPSMETLVKPFKFPASPYEYRVTSLRECPTPESLQHCETPDKAADYWRMHIATHTHFNPDCECLAVLLLNTRKRVKGHQLVSIGTMDTILVHPREVYRLAIIAAASAVIVMHNHPSGESTPSEADIKVTRDLIRAGQLLKMELLDHVVIGNGNFSSLRALGYFYQ